jgi:hypothetical protein
LYLYWLALAALVALHGPGRLSLDALIERWLRRVFPRSRADRPFSGGFATGGRRGAGFGGLACAAGLRGHRCR